MNHDSSDPFADEARVLAEEIELLKAQKPTLVDILIASPFDDKMDVDEKFTEKMTMKSTRISSYKLSMVTLDGILRFLLADMPGQGNQLS